LCRCLSLPGNLISRGNLALSLVYSGVQLNYQRLHLQVDLQHRSKLHILSWTPTDCLLLEIIPSLIWWSGVPRGKKLSGIMISQGRLSSPSLPISNFSTPITLRASLPISLTSLILTFCLITHGSPRSYSG
jgi:hypothetical protein